jgi:23S rRNA (pseudouridine1915-N3)-methyltransferase
MKIQFYSIGKPDTADIQSAVKNFTQRIAHYYPVEWKIISPPKNAASIAQNELKIKEAELILASVKKDDYLIALDESGKMFSSAQLAATIQTCANKSAKQLIFVIGGAYGLDEIILKKANFIWSLSLLTFPHQLVRLILAEQVYRACTIIRNEKYHHA